MSRIEDVDVVFVHYGSLTPTVEAVRSVMSAVHRVIVVSNDGTSRPPGLPETVQWIIAPRNMGFGAAVNIAAEHVTAAKAFILNTDLYISPETVAACARAIDLPTVAVVGPRLNYGDGRLQSGPGHDGTRRAPPTTGAGTGTLECDWVTGAALMTSAATLRRIKFDGSYFLGYEDYDYCVRVRRAGGKVLWLGESIALHASGGVIGPVLWHYYATRNAIWYARAAMPSGTTAWRYARALALLARVVAADCLKRRNFERTIVTFRGLRDSRKGKPTMEEGPWLTEPICLR